MGQQVTDPTGTLIEAQRLGVSRRTIQRQRKKLVTAARSDMASLVPCQQSLAFMPAAAPLRMPKAARISALQAAARAGALEKAVFERLAQAVTQGDVAATKLFSAAWKDVLGGLRMLEEMSEAVLKQKRWDEIARRTSHPQF